MVEAALSRLGPLAHVAHLARRFAGSLSSRPPGDDDDAWVAAVESVGGRALWRQMSAADRRYAVGVAGHVDGALGPGATPAVLAAALLHDVGKVESGLGTFGRVGATVWASVRGRAAAAAGTGRVARYLRHDALGAELLAAAGSDPLTVTWAGEHHLAPARWSLPAPVAAALKAADDD